MHFDAILFQDRTDLLGNEQSAAKAGEKDRDFHERCGFSMACLKRLRFGKDFREGAFRICTTHLQQFWLMIPFVDIKRSPCPFVERSFPMNRWITGSLGALLLSASPVAHAAILVGSYAGAPDPGPIGTVLLDFEAPIVAGQLGNGITIDGNYDVFSGFNPPHAAAPAGDGSAYLAVPGSGYNGFATIDFTGYADVAQIDAFNFYWGSIDTGNRLAIVTSDGTYTFEGGDIISSGFGSTTSADANRRVAFALNAGETLQQIRFYSDLPAFELDDFATVTVPEPASWGLMIAGFGLIGFTLRKRSFRSRDGRRLAGASA